MDSEAEILEVERVQPAPTNAGVAARVLDLMAVMPAPVCGEGVQPLNPGFFQLEAIRAGAGAKSKVAQRQPIEGK